MRTRPVRRSMAAIGLTLALAACGRGAPAPATLDTRNDACQACRMRVSDPRSAAQLVAPGEEPRFFDDIGCLVAYLRGHAGDVARATAYVADHRTKAWVPAARAIYVRVPQLETPMGSHIVAHADLASRQADAAASAGTSMTVWEVFGPNGPPAAGLGAEVAP